MAKGKGKKKAKGEAKSEPKQAASAQGSNSRVRDSIQRECDAEFTEIEAARTGLNERAGELRERLRDAGIDVKAFMAVRKIKHMPDADAREAYIDNLKESWKALKMGQQADFFGQQSEEDIAEQRSAMQKEARTVGREAGRAGQDRAGNPHAVRTKAHKEWDAGWCEGQTEIGKELEGVERPVDTGNGAAAHV